MSSPNIRDLLTSFSPTLDFFAISSGDGRIKIWDTLKGQLQTEFANIASTDALGIRSESERGHLSLDYKCMKWVQLESKKKKKKKAMSSLLVLGTGNGDVLAIDVSLGQLKWKVSDCHPGGVTAVSYSSQNLCIYTAGVDGMVCQIDSTAGRILGKFNASTKAVSALSISADGKLLATASAQLKVFNCSSNKKMQKFSGHPVTVRCMNFSEDGNYILSSAVGERFVAIWKIDGGKNRSASCVLSMEHPAVVLDSKGSDTESKGAGLYVLAISEVGLCYFWYGSSIQALQTSKPTKISLSIDSSLSRNNKGMSIFAAKIHHIISPASTEMLAAYGALVKPSFEKVTLEYGKDMILDASQDGVLLPIGQPNISNKSQVTQTKVTALDRANAEDAILPLPKLYAHEKKRKHGVQPLTAEVKNEPLVNNKAKTWSAHAEVYPQKMEKDGLTSIEDRLRAAGILGAKDNPIVNGDSRNPPDTAIEVAMDNSAHFSIDINMPTKKIRSHILSMSAGNAYKLLEGLLSSWRTRSASPKHVLPWIYHILVIHGQFIGSHESARQMLDELHKITSLRCAAIQPLLNLSGCLHLIMAQIDKAEQNMVQEPSTMQNTDISDAEEEEEDEDIDELVYGEEENVSQSGSDDDNELQG